MIYAHFPGGGGQFCPNSAFTLAEVLITLGIIGIIAAILLPNIMSSYRKKAVEAKLKKFYSIANQAIQQSELDNGPKEYWAGCNAGEDNTISEHFSSCEDWYNKYLKNYLRTLKVEHFRTSGYQNTAVYFNDGSVMVIKSGYDIFFYPFGSDFNKDTFWHVDDSGRTSRPAAGTKYFAFAFRANSNMANAAYYKGKGIEPYRTQYCDRNGCRPVTEDELKNNSTYGCNKNSSSKVYCTALIQDNNWEIPDDYPFKF